MKHCISKRGKKVYENITRFWIKIFAANFSVGVASGIVMEFEFGTNWSTYSRFVGDIFGSPLAAEGIFAFFLESGFLANLLFGWNRVKPGVSPVFLQSWFFVGSMMSAFWIVVANSWQHTPVAYEIVQHGEGMRAVITDFWAMVFNPSAPIRVTHTFNWCIYSRFFSGIECFGLLSTQKQYVEFAQRSFAIALSSRPLLRFRNLWLVMNMVKWLQNTKL